MSAPVAPNGIKLINVTRPTSGRNMRMKLLSLGALASI
jgi:hypothetical protein